MYDITENHSQLLMKRIDTFIEHPGLGSSVLVTGGFYMSAVRLFNVEIVTDTWHLGNLSNLNHSIPEFLLIARSLNYVAWQQVQKR